MLPPTMTIPAVDTCDDASRRQLLALNLVHMVRATTLLALRVLQLLPVLLQCVLNYGIRITGVVQGQGEGGIPLHINGYHMLHLK